MKKWVSVTLCAAIVLAVCVGAALVSLSVLQKPEAEPERYILRDYNGHAALSEETSDVPLAEYEIYTVLLPEEDAELLREGIPISDQNQLQTLLEVLGL